MKAISLFCYLLLALLMMSCGSKKASVNLSVTSGFSLTAAGYTGGLFVYGKSTDGKSFYATAITGSSISVPLINGNWTFTVTGWDGAGPFQGTAYCGRTNVVLDSSTTDINIQTNEANCGTATFTNGMSNLAEAASGFRNLKVNTCSALYSLSSGVFNKVTSSSSTAASFLTDYCSTDIGSFSKSFVDRASSLKIVISGKQTPGIVFPDIATACISTGANAIFNTGLRIPAHNVPVEIHLFDDSTCSDSDPLVYKFSDGFIAGSDSFDSVVNNQDPSSTYNLFIPFNDIRRGYSALMDRLPTLKCGGSNCLPQVLGGVPAQFFIYFGGDYSKIPIPQASACTDITLPPSVAISAAGLDIPSVNYCEDQDGDIFLKVRAATNATCLSGSPCSLSFTVSGVGVTNTFSSDPNFSTERNTYDDIWKIFGNDQTPDSFYRFFERDDESGSILGEIIEEMGPGGSVSIFGDTLCSSLNGTKTISMWEEGQYKTFQVAAQASTLAVPKLICNDNSGNPAASCTTSTFDTKIIFRELINQVWTAKETLHVSCGVGKKIGMIEYQQVKQDGSLLRTEKKIAGWNTTSVGGERVEALVYEKWVNGVSNQIMQEKSGFTRGEVVPGSKFKGQMLGWNAHWNGTNYSEYLLHRDFFSSSGILYSNQKTLDATTSIPGSIFNTNSYTQTFRVPFLNYDSYQSKSPDGLRMVRTWIKHDGSFSRLYMTEFVGGSWSSPKPTPSSYPTISDYISGGTANASEPRVEVADNGDLIMTWIEDSAGTWSVKSLARVAGSWGSILTHSASLNAGQISGLDLFVEGNKAAIVWNQVDTSIPKTRIFLSYTNSTLTTSWISPTNANSHAISIVSDDAYGPKVAFEPGTLKLIVVYRIGVNIIGTDATLSNASLSTDVTPLLTNATNIQTVTSASDPFLFQLADRLVVSYKNMSNNMHYSKEYIYASPVWSSGTPETIRFPMQVTYGKSISSNFNSSTAYALPPSSLSEPSNQNLKGPNNFGLKELKPASINSLFTTSASFMAQ